MLRSPTNVQSHTFIHLLSPQIPHQSVARENTRKITICRQFLAGPVPIAPGGGGAFVEFDYDINYNITDINVLVSLMHPAGDEIKGSLSFKPIGSSATYEFDLFDLDSNNGVSDDGITNTTFNKVQFDDDSTNEIPFPDGPLDLDQGFYKPILDFNDLNGMSTEGLWKLTIADEDGIIHDPGTIKEFCIVVTTNSPIDVQGETDRRRRLKDEALKVRMEAAIEKQNRGREF